MAATRVKGAISREAGPNGEPAMAEAARDRARQVRRASVLLALAGFALLGLLVRLIHINTALAPRLQRIATAQHAGQTTIPARRGMIFDARGRLLASSELRSSVFADPRMTEPLDETARRLAPILGQSAGHLEERMRRSPSPRFCWLARLITPEQEAAIRDLDLRGVGLRREFQRQWVMGTTAAHVLGCTTRDGVGLEGLELAYDAHLRGVSGRSCVVRDARRRLISTAPGAVTPPQDGGHLVLTIDSVIQKMVEHRLRAQVQKFRAEGGNAIVMDPQTGEVLAMACEPTFDPNDFRAAPLAHRRNRILTDPREPGSTFKPIVAAAALQAGYINLTEEIDCHAGVHYFGGRKIEDTKRRAHNTLREILVYSSNIGMGKIGTRMGNDVLYRVVTRFGFGEPTQVGLPGDNAGIVRPLPEWNSYSTTSVPMGHEVSVTPMQLITAFGSLANGGLLLRPRVVRARTDADLRPVEVFDEPEIIRRVTPAYVARFIITDALPGVVARGGKALDARPYAMAAKTGTAEIPYEDRVGYEPNAYLSSCIAAAPVAAPRVVVLVQIVKPDVALGYYGRVVAGPVVADVTRATLEYLQVPPDPPDDALTAAAPGDW